MPRKRTGRLRGLSVGLQTPNLQVLSAEEIVRIHETLCVDFGASADPIVPPGVKSMHLLESAVARQTVGYGRRMKYPDPVSSAATLAFGVCNNHPFHNGNKRTALVAMLAHLDKNRLTLMDTKQDQLFSLMLNVASHTIGLPGGGARGLRNPPRRRHADEEVAALVDWLAQHVQRIQRGERVLTYRQLRQVLKTHGYVLTDPKNNSIDICREERIVTGFFRKTESIDIKRIGNIPYPGDRQLVGPKIVKQVRRICRLTEEDGVDRDAFYAEADVVDVFINRYRTVLRRLART